MRLGAVLAAASCVAACGGGSSSPDGSASCGEGAPTLALGTGSPDYVPLADGDRVNIVCGPQGGRHINVNFRATGLSGEYGLRMRMTDEKSGTVIDAPAMTAVDRQFVVDDGTCAPVAAERFLIGGKKAAWDGRAVVLFLEVTDSADHVVSTERHLVTDVSLVACADP